FLLPEALRARGAQIAEGFVASLNMGAGQFCTNPGLVIAVKSPELDAFIEAAGDALKGSAAQTMLTPGIHDAYQQGVGRLSSNSQVREVARGQAGESAHPCQAGLYVTAAEDFLADTELQEEVFGATSLVIECADLAEVKRVASQLE
ncbi:aldehyde dehydrogenase (NADP(+)), partial [Halomonas sulfidivorans]